MLITARRLIVALLAVAAAGLALGATTQGALRVGSFALAGAAALGLLVFAVRRGALGGSFDESDEITELSEARRRELVRGTSLFLRESRYRYSVRLDASEARARTCFAAEVNSIRLGFVPAIVTDNTTDRQGLGFVAFVHDGHRWRGPGLPCPADQAEAVRHAARCVAPLASDDETRIDGEE